MRACGHCGRPIEAARRDAKWCSKRCRQGAHRTRVGRAELEATSRPLRLAYADPPYMGLSRKYYGDQPSYAGEVDHAELIEALSAGYDGWALSCSSASVPAIAAMLEARQIPARLAVWARRPIPHPTAPIVTAWEGVWYVSARSSRDHVARLSATSDVLEDVAPRRRSTMPGAVIGMKPPAFCTWIFELIGARPGDELVDLFPGSGIVGRTWRDWSGDASFHPAHATLWGPTRLES